MDLYTGMLFSNKEDQVLTHATTWINLENIMLSERSHLQSATDA